MAGLKKKLNHILKNRHRALLISVMCLLLVTGGVLVFADTFSGSSKVNVEGVEYYAALDDEWHRIDMDTTLPGRDTEGSGRYYTTPESLEDYYGKFGFRSEDFDGQLIFPHSAGSDTEQIWADTVPVKSASGEWKIPLANSNKIYIYYLPSNTEGHESYFTRNKSLSDKALLADNMFYSVTISDPDKKVPDMEDVVYVKSGSSYKVTLPAGDGYEWKCVNRNTFEAITPDSETESADGSEVTLRFSKVTQPMKIEPADPANKRIRVVYDAGTLEENLQMLGDVAAGVQAVEKDGQINSSDTYTFTMNSSDTSYRTLYPDSSRTLAKVPGSSQSKKYIYAFRGWKLGNTDTIIEAGKNIGTDEMRKYEIDGEIHLNAVWSGKNDNGRVGSVNFYVNKTCEISDNMTDGFLENPKENFTKSVYTAKVNESDPAPVNPKEDVKLLVSETGDTAYKVDSEIRKLTKDGYDGVSLESFPSDEDVLAGLRKNNEKISVNDQEIPAEDLTTANFKVRWYITKYAHADGWHIDGILVAKAGRIVVKKTFAGAADTAVNELKDDFNITVTHVDDPEADDPEKTDYTLVLKPQKEAGGETTGYDSYDAGTHTYTWILKVRDYQYYTVRENNYTIGKFDRSEHVYLIRNSDEGADAREDTDMSLWQKYDEDEGIFVKADAYPDDAPVSSYQTVELKNLYVTSSFITLDKIDAFNGEGMKNIKFRMSRLDTENALQMYRRPGSNAYSDEADTGSGYGFTEKVKDNIIETDSTGMAYLKLPAGIYMFAEQTPEGYKDAKYFKVTVKDQENGAGTYIGSSVPCDENGSDAAGSNDIVYTSEDASVVLVKNHSEQLTTVTAKAEMGDVSADSVRVELWCNGAKLEGSQYTQMLNGENKWSYTWRNLPLYVDGEVAEYNLRETAIGSVAYDPGVNGDGYADYDVTYDKCRYRIADSGEYNDPVSWKDDSGERHYAKHALLVVNNSVKRAETQYVKVDVSAVWEDEDDRDGIRPEHVDLKLLDKDGNQAGNGISLISDEKWKGTFLELDKYRDGEEIKYFINDRSFETAEGYKAVVTGSMSDGYVITFTHTPSTVDIQGQKVWDDNNDRHNSRPESITVNLMADGEKADSATVRAGSDGSWNWSFNGVPEYRDGRKIRYSIEETPVDFYASSVTQDPDTGRYVITNRFARESDEIEPVSSSVTDQISVIKKLDGRKINAGEFSFELLENGKIAASGSCDADGRVTFDEVTYAGPATHEYTVREKAGNAGGVTYDTREYKITTVVTEKDDGTLDVRHTVSGSSSQEIVFSNSYKPEAAAVSVSAVKHLTGRALENGQFTFQLKDESGEVIDEARNDENGVIDFKELTFDKAGTYHYTVSEVNDRQSDITYDTEEKSVEITVKDNGAGALEAWSESEDQISFTNVYKKSDPSDEPDDPDNPGEPDDPGNPDKPDDPGNSGSDNSGTGTETGDTSDIATALLLMFMAATASGIILVRRKLK